MTAGQKDDSRALTAVLTAACCAYIAWLAYHLGQWVRAFNPLFEGLREMPSLTRFVTNLPENALLAGGAVLIAGLVAKEFFIRKPMVRITVTFLVFVGVNWFAAVCMDMILLTMKGILDKIG